MTKLVLNIDMQLERYDIELFIERELEQYQELSLAETRTLRAAKIKQIRKVLSKWFCYGLAEVEVDLEAETIRVKETNLEENI